MVHIEDASRRDTAIDGLTVFTAKAVTDERGTVREVFRRSAVELPADRQWRQANLTYSVRGAIRGLHGEQMTKLVGVASGTAFGAWVDARPSSPSYGAVVTEHLSAGVQVLVPAGVCNGFQAISDGGCEYFYLFDTEWAPGMAAVSVNPLDPGLAIPWPIEPDPTDPSSVSAKDSSAPAFERMGAG